jgi:hypothetical protein
VYAEWIEVAWALGWMGLGEQRDWLIKRDELGWRGGLGGEGNRCGERRKGSCQYEDGCGFGLAACLLLVGLPDHRGCAQIFYR